MATVDHSPDSQHVDPTPAAAPAAPAVNLWDHALDTTDGHRRWDGFVDSAKSPGPSPSPPRPEVGARVVVGPSSVRSGSQGSHTPGQEATPFSPPPAAMHTTMPQPQVLFQQPVHPQPQLQVPILPQMVPPQGPQVVAFPGVQHCQPPQVHVQQLQAPQLQAPQLQAPQVAVGAPPMAMAPTMPQQPQQPQPYTVPQGFRVFAYLADGRPLLMPDTGTAGATPMATAAATMALGSVVSQQPTPMAQQMAQQQMGQQIAQQPLQPQASPPPEVQDASRTVQRLNLLSQPISRPAPGGTPGTSTCTSTQQSGRARSLSTTVGSIQPLQPLQPTPMHTPGAQPAGTPVLRVGVPQAAAGTGGPQIRIGQQPSASHPIVRIGATKASTPCVRVGVTGPTAVSNATTTGVGAGEEGPNDGEQPVVVVDGAVHSPSQHAPGEPGDAPTPTGATPSGAPVPPPGGVLVQNAAATPTANARGGLVNAASPAAVAATQLAVASAMAAKAASPSQSTGHASSTTALTSGSSHAPSPAGRAEEERAQRREREQWAAATAGQQLPRVLSPAGTPSNGMPRSIPSNADTPTSEAGRPPPLLAGMDPKAEPPLM